MFKVLWNCSDVFFQVKTNQKHICNVFVRPKLRVLKLFQNWKNPLNFWLPAMRQMTLSWLPAFTQQSGHWNGSIFTSRRRTTFLKICRIFFEVQRRVWSALRSFLNSSTSHFRSLLKITCLHENMQEFLLEPHLTPWDSFGWRKNLFLVLRSFWKCSQVFFQVKRNQKHI